MILLEDGNLMELQKYSNSNKSSTHWTNRNKEKKCDFLILISHSLRVSHHLSDTRVSDCCCVSTEGPEFQESFMTSGVFSVTELVQVSRSKSTFLPPFIVKSSLYLHRYYNHSMCSPFCVAPVVTGVGPSFSMGELQGHLAYDLNQSVNQPVSLRRSLASTSSSG